MNKSKIIHLTSNFRIEQTEGQYTVQQLVTIDPQRSPRSRSKVVTSSEIRTEWKDKGYYGINMSGLESAIKYIIVQEARLQGESLTDLKTYLQTLRELSNQIHSLVHVS